MRVSTIERIRNVVQMRLAEYCQKPEMCGWEWESISDKTLESFGIESLDVLMFKFDLQDSIQDSIWDRDFPQNLTLNAICEWVAAGVAQYHKGESI